MRNESDKTQQNTHFDVVGSSLSRISMVINYEIETKSLADGLR